MKKTLLTAAALLFLFIPEVRAVDYPSNWSLDLKGGITSGFFTFDSKTTPQAGFQVRYSMNPVVSFYGDMAFGQFRSEASMQDANGFSSDYFAIGLGTRMNILRMLTGLNSVTENFGLYASTGIGLMRGDLSVSNVELPGYVGRDAPVNAVIYRITTGATYRISRRLDIFAQAEFNHSGSDLLDGYERRGGGSTGRFSGGDSFLNASAGFSIKFGRSRVRHSDWQQWDHRTDPLALSLQRDVLRLEAKLQETENTQAQLTQRIQSLNQTINEFSHLINTAHKDEFKRLERKIESLEERLEPIQPEAVEVEPVVPAEPVAPEEPARVEPVEPTRVDPSEHGFFVVAAVFRTMANAERGLGIIRNEGFEGASIQHDQRRNNYLVVYSGHPTREAALDEMRRIRAEVNPDSWVFVK